MNSLKDVRNNVAKALFGMTRSEALEISICVRCKEDVFDLGGPDESEYRSSALCPSCFETITNDLDFDEASDD